MNYLFLIFIFTLNCFGSINFIHINKTGGTTLRTMLTAYYPHKDFYPYLKLGTLWQALYMRQGKIWNPVDMNGAFNKFPPITEKIAAGHFPIWFLQKKDPNFFSTSFNFTILRDPVDRVLSHYFFMKKIKHPVGDPVQSPLEIPPNHMCHMLSSDNTLTGEALLRDAMANLDRMDCVIFQDNFEEGVGNLFNQLGLGKCPKIPRLNATAREVTFDGEMIQKIREMNDLDLRLYEYAKRSRRS